MSPADTEKNLNVLSILYLFVYRRFYHSLSERSNPFGFHGKRNFPISEYI